MKEDFFCCKEISEHLKNGEIHLHYHEDVRAYLIDYLKEAGGGGQIINYCPWCGHKLPKELFLEKADILEKEIGLDITCFNEDQVPKEFQTDEWWKKRGL